MPIQVRAPPHHLDELWLSTHSVTLSDLDRHPPGVHKAKSNRWHASSAALAEATSIWHINAGATCGKWANIAAAQLQFSHLAPTSCTLQLILLSSHNMSAADVGQNDVGNNPSPARAYGGSICCIVPTDLSKLISRSPPGMAAPADSRAENATGRTTELSLAVRAQALQTTFADPLFQKLMQGTFTGALDTQDKSSGAARGMNPSGPDAGFRDILNDPVFNNILVGALSGAVTGLQTSINTASNAAANGASSALGQTPEAGILSLLKRVANHPLTGQIVSGAVTGVVGHLTGSDGSGQASSLPAPAATGASAPPSRALAAVSSRKAIGIQNADGTWRILTYISGDDALVPDVGDNHPSGGPDHGIFSMVGSLLTGVLGAI